MINGDSLPFSILIKWMTIILIFNNYIENYNLYIRIEMSEGNILERLGHFKDHPNISPLFLTQKGSSEGSNISFSKHFNPELAIDSEYFKSLNHLMSCVEKHAGSELAEKDMERVCAKEYKNLRLTAMDNKVFYHYVNKKHFMNELSLYNHESPY